MSPEQSLVRETEHTAANVVEAIDARVRQSPHAPALRAGRRELTYGQLAARSGLLARRLLRAGFAAGDLAAVCVEPSPDFVVAALAAMKAGGAYLPLDPASPPDRLQFMLADSRARALITSPQLRPSFHAPQVTVLELDGSEPAPPDSTRAAAAGPLAYLIYTSGSTGRPKGVEISHPALWNLVGWHNTAFTITADDRASQVAGLGFDAAVWEIWPYLCAGASLSIAGGPVRQDPTALQQWLVAEQITVAFVPTALAERLVDREWPAETTLRWLLTGGEALRRYPRAGLPFVLVNNYGPTESTVVATSGVGPSEGPSGAPPSIGRPIANTEVYLLDDDLRPVPQGAPGEICIGGAGLALGYRNRPELTAERFVSSPFAGSGRLYRTGDMARRRPDGDLEFLGRVDDQVKIRGCRIELNEVATALAAHPEIAQSAVVAREDEPGQKSLVGYVVLTPESPLTHGELREFLERSLPDYMIPTQFVALDALPRNGNGKVDRRALPAPTRENTLENAGAAEPRTALEQQIAAIIAELLKLDRIGVEDNFFLLGGHSLLGAQLIARLREQFDVDVPLRALFEAPTVASLSAEIERLVIEKVNAMSDEDVSRSLG